MLSSNLRRFLLALSPLPIGCVTSPQSKTPIPGPQLRGSVFGGQQPISGASVQLYAAGTSNYGAGAQPLLSTPAITGADGSFTPTGAYACP